MLTQVARSRHTPHPLMQIMARRRDFYGNSIAFDIHSVDRVYCCFSLQLVWGLGFARIPIVQETLSRSLSVPLIVQPKLQATLSMFEGNAADTKAVRNGGQCPSYKDYNHGTAQGPSPTIRCDWHGYLSF